MHISRIRFYIVVGCGSGREFHCFGDSHNQGTTIGISQGDRVQVQTGCNEQATRGDRQGTPNTGASEKERTSPIGYVGQWENRRANWFARPLGRHKRRQIDHRDRVIINIHPILWTSLANSVTTWMDEQMSPEATGPSIKGVRGEPMTTRCAWLVAPLFQVTGVHHQGLDDVTHRTGSSSERYQRLKVSDRNWRNMSWSS